MSSTKGKTGRQLGLNSGSRKTQLSRFRDLACADPQIRIDAIRKGFPAHSVTQLARRLGKSKTYVINMLGLSCSSISRKERGGLTLSSNETERLLGLESLIATVQTLVEESGDPVGFNASRWVSDWLTRPLSALGGETPGSYMDTYEGQKLITDLIATSQSGAYV